MADEAHSSTPNSSEIRRDPERVRELFRDGKYPYKTRVKVAAYEAHKKELQVELLKVQPWVKESGQRIIVIFEGRDAAGKGGTIKRVMGFGDSLEYLEFMRQVPDFERMLTRSGIRFFKYWFSMTKAEQERRFAGRSMAPLKQWKLSPIDQLSRDKWDEYKEAKEAIFLHGYGRRAVDRSEVRRQETRA